MTEPATTFNQFRSAMMSWDADHPRHPVLPDPPTYSIERALYACWWFIENVSADDPWHNDIFFVVREIVRSTQHEALPPST